ncbi:VapE domain-containing protein [Falsiroseomonas sp. E2-1-a20]|uniref:VapE domain-containing protein n=1 Tax=Falsiroseomonas sp. E2-1-a20 TaxID=3239300 RepID=UPI003F302FE6
MLDATDRAFADEDARLLFGAHETDIDARLVWLKSGDEGDLPTPHSIFTGLNMDHPALCKLRDYAVTTLGFKAKDIDTAIRNERVRQALGAVPRHPLEYVHLWTERRCYTVLADGAVVSPTGAEMLHRVMLGARVEANILHLQFTPGSVNDAVEKWYYVAKEARRGEIITAISEPMMPDEVNSVQAALVDLCRRSFDTSESSPEFAAAVLMKFCHQVRRKALSLPVSGHLVPVIVGKQGAGKSEFCKRLLRPIWEVTAVVDFKIICDDRNIDLWANHALFLDEMGKSTKADIETVRQCVTADKLDRRPMHTNSLVKVPQRATFIGTGNADVLAELIADPTGTRRFALLTFSKNAEWDAINAFDWFALWRSVDPYGPDPIMPFKCMLAARQEEARDRSPGEVWIEGLTAFARKVPLTSAELHGIFRDWEQRHSPRTATSLVAFGREMSRIEKTGKLPFLRTGAKAGTTFEWRGHETIVDLDERRPTAATRGHI